MIDTGSIQITRSRHAGRAVLPPHEHTRAYLSFVIAGEYRETVSGHSVECGTYRVRYHPAGEVHSDAFGNEGATCLNLELDAAWSPALAELRLTDPEDVVLADDCAGLALRLLAAAWESHPHTLTIEELSAAMLDRCAATRRRSKAAGSRRAVRRAVEYIHEHVRTPVTLRHVAEAACLHPTHLARVFRSAMGETIGDYSRRARVVLAEDTIRRHPHWPLSWIAAEAGFADHSHMTRELSRVCGLTPSAFRRLSRAASIALEPINRLDA